MKKLIIGDFTRATFFVLVFAILAGGITSAFARPAVMEKKTLIVALGDSLTAGTPFFQSPLEVPPKGKGDGDVPYAAWMMKDRPKWTVVNMGIAGQTSSQIRARFMDGAKLGPRYIIVFAGTNDVVQGIDAESIANNLKWMYQQCKSYGAMPVAVTLPPFDPSTSEQIRVRESVNKWIRSQAERQRMPIVDASEALSDPNDSQKLNGSPDGYHPDVGGYRTLGKKFIEAIDPIEKAWRR